MNDVRGNQSKVISDLNNETSPILGDRCLFPFGFFGLHFFGKIGYFEGVGRAIEKTHNETFRFGIKAVFDNTFKFFNITHALLYIV